MSKLQVCMRATLVFHLSLIVFCFENGMVSSIPFLSFSFLYVKNTQNTDSDDLYKINYRFSKSANNFDFRISYKVLQKENAVVRFGGVPVHMSNRSRSSTSYYNKNIYTDNEQIEGKLGSKKQET